MIRDAKSITTQDAKSITQLSLFVAFALHSFFFVFVLIVPSHTQWTVPANEAVNKHYITVHYRFDGLKFIDKDEVGTPSGIIYKMDDNLQNTKLLGGTVETVYLPCPDGGAVATNGGQCPTERFTDKCKKHYNYVHTHYFLAGVIVLGVVLLGFMLLDREEYVSDVTRAGILTFVGLVMTIAASMRMHLLEKIFKEETDVSPFAPSCLGHYFAQNVKQFSSITDKTVDVVFNVFAIATFVWCFLYGAFKVVKVVYSEDDASKSSPYKKSNPAFMMGPI